MAPPWLLDRIRQRFNWLELIGADGGYNARQVEHVVAAQPPLRVETRQTSRRQGRIYRPAAPVGR